MATFTELAKDLGSIAEMREALGIPPNKKAEPSEKPRKSESDLKVLKEYRWNPATKIEPSKPIARFADKVEIRRKNVSALSSKSGGGKTSFVGGLTGSLAGGEGDFLGWQVCERKGAVVLFDYEQSPEDFDDCCRRIWERAETEPPPWFYAYHLRDFPLDNRKDLTELAIEQVKIDAGSIDLVILDGGSDLVRDVNDPKEAPEAVGKWLAMSSRFDCHILVVIHLNESNQAGVDPRGWLGKELMRKCEAAFTLNKSKERTKVHTAKHRKAGLSEDQAFAFEWSDEKKMHVSVGTVASDKAEKARQKRQERLELVETIYTSKSAGMQPLGAGLQYKELTAAISEHEGCSEPTAKRRVSELKRENLIHFAYGHYYASDNAKSEILKD
jgi:hypothetical protein